MVLPPRDAATLWRRDPLLVSRLGSDVRLAVKAQHCHTVFYCTILSVLTMPTVRFLLPFSSRRMQGVAEICGVGPQLSHGPTRSFLCARRSLCAFLRSLAFSVDMTDPFTTVAAVAGEQAWLFPRLMSYLAISVVVILNENHCSLVQNTDIVGSIKVFPRYNFRACSLPPQRPT